MLIRGRSDAVLTQSPLGMPARVQHTSSEGSSARANAGNNQHAWSAAFHASGLEREPGLSLAKLA